MLFFFSPLHVRRQSPSGSHELYWSMGDSGPQLDTFDNGQNPDTLHGSIIRIEVTSEMGSGYSIPSSNPFSGGGKLRFLVLPALLPSWLKKIASFAFFSPIRRFCHEMRFSFQAHPDQCQRPVPRKSSYRPHHGYKYRVVLTGTKGQRFCYSYNFFS